MIEEYYDVKFECCNCKFSFWRTIPKGTRAEGKGGVCPNCRVIDEATHPFSVIKTNKLEVLLENQ